MCVVCAARFVAMHVSSKVRVCVVCQECSMCVIGLPLTSGHMWVW